MHMTGEQHIAASREKVWAALNDPDVLRRCIPGCQSLERDGDNRFAAVAEVKIGPIGARFKGNVELGNLDPPNGYTITGSGNGGIAGSAKGSARVRLSEAGSGTLVSYEVDADVGGRMAQLGGPIIDATAKNLAAKFFTTFGEVVSGKTEEIPLTAAPSPQRASVPGPVADTTRVQPVPPTTNNGDAPLWGWAAAIVTALLAGFMLGASGRYIEALIALVLLIITAAAAYEAGRRGARQ